jgi:hypothetical protein
MWLQHNEDRSAEFIVYLEFDDGVAAIDDIPVRIHEVLEATL